MSKVGKSEIRVDAFDKVTGRTKYYEDRMPAGALYARIKHSTIAHGFVKSVDKSAAEAIPGVVKVLTCFDVPEHCFPTARGAGACRILDLCAGSGCIGLAAAANLPNARVLLGEYDEEALKICRQNIRRNRLTARVASLKIDAREKPARTLGEFQFLVSNPPYIPSADIDTLDASVREHEPRLALDGGADGLDFYRVICEKWRDALCENGMLFFEVGIGQADQVLRIMRSHGFGDIQIVKDLNNIPRVVYGTRVETI